MNEEKGRDRAAGARADFDLIFRQIEQLRELVADRDSAADADRRYDFGIRWGVLLSGRLQRLIYYESRGDLSDDEKRLFDEMAAKLREVAPLAEQLGLADPTAGLKSQGQES